MRFGVKLMPQHCTWPELLDLFRAADQNPFFESAWTFDHFYPIYGDWEGPCLESWVTLSALAQATSRIRIGSMVNGIVYRHPAVTANMASALDIVSNGRLDLGLGAGWNERECQAYGIELGTLKERFDRFEESVQCIAALMRDQSVTLAGKYFTLTDARNEPIVIGGGGEKRTLRIAAKYAQHWNFPGGRADDFRRKLDVLHGHCADIGRDPAEITTSTHLLMWPDKTVDDVARQAEVYASTGLDVGIVYLEAPVSPSVIDDLARVLAPFAG